MPRHYRAARNITVLFWLVLVVDRVLPRYTAAKGMLFCCFKYLDIVGKTSQTWNGYFSHVKAVVILQDRAGQQ